MNMIYARTTVSVTELKRDYAAVIRAADEGGAIAVLNHNKPEAYILSARDYEKMLDLIEDMEDAELIRQRLSEPSVAVDINDL